MTEVTLRRYTSLPFLIDILKWKKLTLVNPITWDDKNDSFFITTYKNRLELQSVLALCFAEYHETYFHWKLYAGDTCGVCIEFDKELLLLQLNDFEGIRSGYVHYKELDELRGVELDQLPFTKRYGFSEENEFRILYEDRYNKFSRKDVPININCIRRVIFNPWIPQHVYKSNRDIIKKMCEVKQLNIIKSTINNNKTWKKWGSEIAGSTSLKRGMA